MHATECDAYDILKDIKDFPLPLVYFSRKHVSEDRPGVLIMEDLTRRGVHMEIHTGGSKQLCLNFVRNFAIFQVRQKLLTNSNLLTSSDLLRHNSRREMAKPLC